MSKKKEDNPRVLQKKINALTRSLVRDVQMNEEGTQVLSQTWRENLNKYENTVLHQQLVSYHRSVTMQMDFKDKLIEKLQNWFDESSEYRTSAGLKKLELVNNVLDLFKQQIDGIHDQYQFKIKSALPKSTTELQVGSRENDDQWNILKYLGDVLRVQIQKNNIKRRNNHIKNMNDESGRLESIIETINWKDKMYYSKMTVNYTYVLNEYKIKTEDLMKDFIELKRKNQHWLAEKKTMSKRIKQLLNTINKLNEEPDVPKSSQELKALEEEFIASKKSLISSKIQTTNISKFSEKKIEFLYKTTDAIIEEINDILKKGDFIMKIIKFCRKIESSIRKTSFFPTFDEHNNVEQTEPDSDLEEVPLFWKRVSYVELSTVLRHKENNKLQRENDKLKEEINLLRSRCKQQRP